MWSSYTELCLRRQKCQCSSSFDGDEKIWPGKERIALPGHFPFLKGQSDLLGFLGDLTAKAPRRPDPAAPCCIGWGTRTAACRQPFPRGGPVLLTNTVPRDRRDTLKPFTSRGRRQSGALQVANHRLIACRERQPTVHPETLRLGKRALSAVVEDGGMAFAGPGLLLGSGGGGGQGGRGVLPPPPQLLGSGRTPGERRVPH